MTRRMFLMLIIVGIIFGGIFGFEMFKGKKIKEYMASMGAPVQTVSTTKAALEDWQPQLEAVGSLRAINGVDIANELAGVVEEINFDSGNDVKAGTLLIKLRAEDDVAQLHSLEAAAKLAETTYQRDQKQFKAQAISQAQLDTDAANLTSTKSQVAQQAALIDKKFIKAPFSGHMGIRNVDVGQYLNPGTAIVTLQQLDPIYLDFFLPEQALSEIKLDQKITVKSNTYPDKDFIGTIAAINPKVDTASRNVQVRASLSNSEHLLLPGMYATAKIDTGEPQKFITLPQTSITYNPYGNTVFTVDDKGKNAKGEAQSTAKQTFVTVGKTRGDQVAILKGVEEGDTVVTSGQIKLQNGSPVTVDNTVTPTSDAAPKPQDK